jgi:hypothetical protein
MTPLDVLRGDRSEITRRARAFAAALTLREH